VPAPKEEGIPGEESAPRSRSGFCPAESGAAPCLPQGNLQRVLAYSRQTPRFLASIAMLFGAIFTILLLPAYGQQEVDPTWYDPWAAPSTAVAHPSQPPAVVHSSQPPVATDPYQQKATTVSLAPGAGKFRGRDTQLDQSRHNAAHKSGGTPSAESRLPGTACLAGFETRRAETRNASVPHGGGASRSA
jgi:hypothetical protein